MNSSFRFIFVFIFFLILFFARVYALPPSTTKVLLLCDVHFDPLADKSIVKDLRDADVSEWSTIFASADSFKKDLYPSLGQDTNYRLLTSALSEMTSKEPFDFVDLRRLSSTQFRRRIRENWYLAKGLPDVRLENRNLRCTDNSKFN